MAVRIRRLATGIISTTSLTTVFTAKTRTVIRTIDGINDSNADIAWGINSTSSSAPAGTDGTIYCASNNGIIGYDSTIEGGEWRGAVVLEPGEKLVVQVSDVSLNNVPFTVCGVTGLP